MLKRLAILAIAAFLTVSVSGQGNKNSASNPEPTKQERPTLSAANGEERPTQAGGSQSKAGSNSPTGNAPIERSHWWADSNWWLVIIAGCTGLVIGWQSWETRKAAEGAQASAKATEDSARAMSKSVELQEVQFKQWVEVCLWKNMTPHIQPTATEATLTLGFEVGNATSFPLTLKRIATSKGTGSSTISMEFLIAPEDSYSAFYSFDVSPAELELYRLNRLTVSLSVEAVIKDVLDRECAPQRFVQTITFGPTRCEAIDHPRHFQLKIKQIG